MKFGPGAPPVRCRNCGGLMVGAAKQATEMHDARGRKILVGLQFTHQPCGCVWSHDRQAFYQPI